MKQQMTPIKTFSAFSKTLIAAVTVFASLAVGFVQSPAASAQTCGTTTAPATTLGQVTQTVNVTTAGSYRVWSRIKAPNATANSYYLQFGAAGCAINVGDAAIPANTWTWVNYAGGVTGTPTTVTLAVGSQVLKYTGKEADVQLDRVLLLTDTACVPTGTGNNCAVNDTTSPTVSMSASPTTVTAGASVNLSATATDASGITKVEFYNGTTLIGTPDTTAPYGVAWNTTGQTAGTKTLTAKAFDTAGNIATSAGVSVVVNGGSTTEAIPFRMNTGGAAFTDSAGAAWKADAYFTGGTAVLRSATLAIANTTIPQIYQAERWGMSAYNIPVANGTYAYRLHFAETSTACTTVGCRVFNVTAEGAPVLTNFDIRQEAGAVNRALVKSGTITVADGTASFGFSATANNALINGIEILASAPTDTTPPTVSVGLAQTTVPVGGTATVTATASDNVGVTRVEFYMDGNTAADLWATDTTAPYSYSWSPTLAGTKIMSAKAFDAAGNSTVSGNITLTVGTTPPVDTTLPTVSLTAPANGATAAVGSALNITATASDNVGVTRVEFYRGTTLLSSDTTSPYAATWTPAAADAGAQSLTARAFDAAGNTRTSTAVSVTVPQPVTGNGDTNGDQRVNALDLSAVISHDGENYPPADFNGDGTVGAADLAILIANWTW